MDASPVTLSSLAVENRRYEERFGHVFLIAASGRSAVEILAELRRRMNNDAATELQEAAREQRRIARLRLEKALSELASRPTCSTRFAAPRRRALPWPCIVASPTATGRRSRKPRPTPRGGF